MIKFFLLFIPRIMIENWRRLLILAVSITLFTLAYRVERETEFTTVESIFQDGDTYYYKLYGGDMEKFETKQQLFTDKISNSNVCLKRQVIGEDSIVYLVLGVVALIAFVVIAVMEDWDITEITNDIVGEHLDSEVIDNVYHYHVFGRLIERSINSTMNVRWLTPIKIMQRPRFKSKRQEREDKLNEIGL
jgi:hypothetical protein